MISRFSITGGGGADSVINDADGGDGVIQRLITNPVILGAGAIVAYMTFGDR